MMAKKRRTAEQIREAARASTEKAAAETAAASLHGESIQTHKVHRRGRFQRHYGTEPNARRFPLELFMVGCVLLIAAFIGTYHVITAIFHEFMRFI